ncbi:MAG TPA: FeoB small GTPase domain-containing protein [Pyrinomonadaceae bacterium]|nr:FeoB small GTPase domain-containing protein [Pyrinomonadaceae bacterium]
MLKQGENKVETACGGCAAAGCGSREPHRRAGGEAQKWDYTIALAGNPNTGKSTIFNALTGLRQHVGNWAGKTVARAEGYFGFNDKKYRVVDLPGTYSLLSTSLDEEIARDYLLFGEPDVTTVVIDATRVERNLHLVLQILEITDRVVVALNLMDEARRNSIRINERNLEKDLGIPVVPMAARRGEGVRELLTAIEKTALNPPAVEPRRFEYLDAALEKAVETLTAQLCETFGNLPNARWVAMRLLEGDESIIAAVRDKTLGTKAENTGLQFPQLAEVK